MARAVEWGLRIIIVAIATLRGTGLRWLALATGALALVGRLFLAQAFHHFLAGGLGGSCHHVAAGGLARATPNGLAAHGNGLGPLAWLGHKVLHNLHGNLLLGKALNGLHKAFFVQAHQAHRLALCACAARAANAVHIVFAHVGDLVVHHVRQLVNVNAAGRNVGRHQRTHLAGFKTTQRLRAGGLALVAVQGHGGNAVFVQKLGHMVGTKLGARKHQHLAPVVLVDDVGQQRLLFGAAHGVNGLLNALHRGVGRRDLNVLGVAQQAIGQLTNLVAKRGRKQQALLARGQQLQNLLHVVDEAHVEHAVGFVQHQNLHLAQVQVALVGQVEQAAGGGHQHINAFADFVDLGVHAHAAKHCSRFELQVLAVGLDRLFHLGGQLACGGQHQGAHRAALAALGGFPAVLQTVQHGQGKACGFAGAGLGPCQ